MYTPHYAMACHIIISISMVSLTPFVLMLMAIQTSGKSIGVGMKGNNQRQPSDVVALYKSNNIGRMRLHYPTPAALSALRGSNIQLALDVDNASLPTLASDPSSAAAWVHANVVAYWPDVAFRYIVVGNEAIPGDQAQYVLPAMQNTINALSSAGLQGKIKVSTSVSMAAVGASYPPSDGAMQYMGPIVQFLLRNGSPLIAHVGTSPVSATVDALYSALETAGGSNVGIVVSVTGQQADGGFAATVSDADTYVVAVFDVYQTKGQGQQRILSMLAAIWLMISTSVTALGVYYLHKMIKFDLSACLVF